MLSTKNHLPGFSTLASSSVIGGAEGGSLLIASDGAPANHAHYSFKMTVLDAFIIALFRTLATPDLR